MGQLKQVEIETKKHIGLCKDHGNFESLKTKINGTWRGGKCPTCTANKSIAKSSKFYTELPKRFKNSSFENFKVNDNQKLAYSISKKYSMKFLERLEQGGGLVFYGKCGTGKTHLSCAIANYIVKNNLGDCHYTKVYELTGSVKSSWSDINLNENEIIKSFTNPDLLIIDEVGVQFGSDAEQLILFRILNKRYEDIKPTIIVSNLDKDGLNKYLGERVVDRMHEGGGALVAFDWNSYRRQKP